MINIICMLIDITLIQNKLFRKSESLWQRKECAARENMRDDKIYRLVSARSIVHSLALVCPVKLVAVREKGYTTNIETLVGEQE